LPKRGPRRTGRAALPYPLVTTGGATGFLPTGYLPIGLLPIGYLPTGAGWATGCGRGRSAATAVPTKANVAALMITNFSIEGALLQLKMSPDVIIVKPTIIKGATNRLPNQRLRDLFSPDVAETGPNLSDSALGGGLLRSIWENPFQRRRHQLRALERPTWQCRDRLS
jgi:hypothetical protein